MRAFIITSSLLHDLLAAEPVCCYMQTAAASEGGTWQHEPFRALQESRHLCNSAAADSVGARLADGDYAMLACRPLLGYRCVGDIQNNL